MATGAEVRQAISSVLEQCTFPSLNIVFSATGRLLEKNRRVMTVEAQLQKLEVRVLLRPLDRNGNELSVNPPSDVLEILGLNPSGTTAVKVVIPPEKKTGLRVTFGSAEQPEPKIEFRILEKATIAGPNEFS